MTKGALELPSSVGALCRQVRLERELGIPCAEQEVRTADGAVPDQLSESFQTLYVCGKQRVGPRVWFHVQHRRGQRFVVARSSDTVARVLSRLRALELEGLHLDGKELASDRRLSDCGVACLATLQLRERGALRLSVAVELVCDEAAVMVEVGVDPADSVAELRRRALFKAVDEPLRRRRLEHHKNTALYLEGVELDNDRSVADYSLDACTGGLLLRNL